MTDSAYNLDASDETSLHDDAPPQFGLLDVVEAFTALRHEWRGQTRESRAAAESIDAALTAIQGLEEKLLAALAEFKASETNGGESNEADDGAKEARNLAVLVADVDHQLTRSIAAVEQSETNRRLCEQSDANAIEQYFSGMNAVARWFARPLLTFVTELGNGPVSAEKPGFSSLDPTIEGLNLLLARLRRKMQKHHIERIDTLGQPFDANTMNAIGTVDSADYPSGHVAEQLSPCYRWHGRLLQFADVRVAARRESGNGSPAAIE